MKVEVKLTSAQVCDILASHFKVVFPTGSKVRMLKEESYIYWSLSMSTENTLQFTDEPEPQPAPEIEFYEIKDGGFQEVTRPPEETQQPQPTIPDDYDIPF